MVYISSYQDQNWLLPPSINEIIPKDHICFLVENYVEELDFSDFDLIYERAGHPAYHPRIIMKILVYGMLCKTRSSRRLARATRENFVFMYLAEKVHPDFINASLTNSGCSILNLSKMHSRKRWKLPPGTILLTSALSA